MLCSTDGKEEGLTDGENVGTNDGKMPRRRNEWSE